MPPLQVKPPFICVVTGTISSTGARQQPVKPPFICVVTGTCDQPHNQGHRSSHPSFVWLLEPVCADQFDGVRSSHPSFVWLLELFTPAALPHMAAPHRALQVRQAVSNWPPGKLSSALRACTMRCSCLLTRGPSIFEIDRPGGIGVEAQQRKKRRPWLNTGQGWNEKHSS